jgi:hypothetical protein
MNLRIDLRRPLVRLALIGAAILAIGLMLPICATAGQAEARAQEKATRTEEKAVRAEERAVRAEERTARAEERAARRDGAEPSAEGTSESGEGAHQPASELGGSSSASAYRGCRIGIEASSRRVSAGAAVTLSGTLQCPTEAAAAEQQVAIYQRQAGAGGAGAYSLVGTVTTDADGAYELASPAVYANTVFQVRIGRRHARAAVRVAAHVTIAAAPASAQVSAAGGRSRLSRRAWTTFTGTVSPLDTGALVALQVADAVSGERWRSVAFGHVAADGSYSIAHSFRTPGEVSVRTIVRARGLNVPAVSEPLSLEVSQPQNPQLTIESSADPLTYGATVTISGVAAGAAGQTVTLLARTRGGSFVAVAETTTDEGGEYSFTQTPLASSDYRVIDAGARSTVLPEDVAFALSTEPVPSTVGVGETLTISGTLTPAPVGQPAYLEREYSSGVGFHVVDVGTVNANSQFAIAYTFESAGTSVFRVKVPGDGQLQASAGAPFTVIAERQ